MLNNQSYFIQALWLSGYSDRLEIYFLREQEFESLRRRIFCPLSVYELIFCSPEIGEKVGALGAGNEA